jgi:hypothetical protein
VAFATLASALLVPATGMAAPPKAPAAESATGPAVTFTGFRILKSGGSQVEVVFTSEPRVEESVSGKMATYLLVGVRVPVRNNLNPLITKDFDSVVDSARILSESGKKKRSKAKAKATLGPGVHLVVELREAAKPQHRVVRNADGTATLLVEFPKPAAR